MPVTRWHYGKLIILWVWGIALSALLWYVVEGLEPGSGDVVLPILGLAGLGLAFLIPVVLSVVTWIWLGGKEGPEPEEGDDAG